MQEPRLCVKPVYNFGRAFICDENIPEFCLIYSEADDPETIFVSINSANLKNFEKILYDYKICKIICHGENGRGELYESFYYNNINEKFSNDIKNLYFRVLTTEDKNLVDSGGKDDYLHVIFEDFIEKKIWSDCGIIGAFSENNDFKGYLAYYEIAENIRDVSYIYIKGEYRKTGCAKKLLEYFVNKNIAEKKVSYYSYAADGISEKLVKSCGFLPCAKRTEANIKNDRKYC